MKLRAIIKHVTHTPRLSVALEGCKGGKKMPNRLLVPAVLLLGLLAACGGSGGNVPQPPPGGNGPQPPPADNGSATPLHNTIAYVQGTTGDEIRLVNPDGSGDRLLWAHGQDDPEEVYAVWNLAWRPDARALTFASTHENWCSLNHADIFSLGGDGTGYRRVTEAPACADLAAYPKGTVQVPVENPSYETFVGFVYFQGAPGIQQVSLPPGGSGVVTFENVADLGSGEDGLQIATTIVGVNREIAIGTAVDVQAGGTVTTAPLTVYTPSTYWEAHSPTWHSGGSRLGYILNFNSVRQIVPNPTPLDFGEELQTDASQMPDFAKLLAWGPASRTDQLLYAGNIAFDTEGIYLMAEGSATAGERLVSYDATEAVLGLAWLPDGSGFVYSVTEGDYFGEERGANLFVYDIASRQITRITSFTGEFAGPLSVSPDARQIVFERAAEMVEFGYDLVNPELWVVNRDGSGFRLLIENGRAPAWSP